MFQIIVLAFFIALFVWVFFTFGMAILGALPWVLLAILGLLALGAIAVIGEAVWDWFDDHPKVRRGLWWLTYVGLPVLGFGAYYAGQL